MDDEIESAMEIGRQNADLISLGKAWCTHIRNDRTGMGIGLVEEMTGLPITGGRFTCDYARDPSGFAGMHLDPVGFYVANCRGCTDRAPGGRVPNLGTLAEGELAERAEQEEKADAARVAELAERQRRSDHRTLVAAQLDAASQQIVALVNQLDIDPGASDAAAELSATAKLTPELFVDPIRAMLHTDSKTLRSAVLLDVLLIVEAGDFRADLHATCLDAVRTGWAPGEAFRHLAEHGVASDVDAQLAAAVIRRAGPSGLFLGGGSGDASALLRYHAVATAAVEDLLAAEFRRGESHRRACAASASRTLIDVDVSVGRRLLPAMLDGLRHREGRYDHDHPSDKIAKAVAVVLVADPSHVEAAVASRWMNASPEYRRRLIACYDSPVRRSSGALSADVAEVILGRCAAALHDAPDLQSFGIEDDYQGRASDLLAQVATLAPISVLSADVLLGLLLQWVGRERKFHESPPTGPMAGLERFGGEGRLGHLRRDIVDAVSNAAERVPTQFVDACSDLFNGTDGDTWVRAELVRILGRIAHASHADRGDCLPLIYGAMLGDDQGVRAAGQDAAEEILRSLPAASVPPVLAEAVAAGLADQYLVVVRAAISAISRVPPDLLDHRSVSMQLLNAAVAYAGDRRHDQMVQDALRAARRLSRDDAEWESIVRRAVLGITRKMPAHSARNVLSRNRWLAGDDEWADAAIDALRPDEDPQYEYLGDDDKEWLLAELGTSRLNEAQVEMLAAREVDAASIDLRRATLGADSLGELARPDLSAGVIQAFLDTIPETIEKRPMRAAVELELIAYKVEVAASTGDVDARQALHERVEALCAAG
ncbi:MAG: hypothetical protein ACE37B_01200 [Ilumatobacter sp.]|uniref:hypothetical protein n=1 Tax=Ilumatobacter sp. TaxID=1967498 RepID=UPI0039187A86